MRKRRLGHSGRRRKGAGIQLRGNAGKLLPRVAGPPTRSAGLAAGFSLIELMVVLAILALIASLAVPLYTGYSQRAFRSEAQSTLMACALGMERWAGVEFTYAGAADTDGDGVGDADTGPVAAAICNAGSAAGGNYSITVEGGADGFLLTARPAADGAMAGDGFLALDADGNRRWDRDDNGEIGPGEDRWE